MKSVAEGKPAKTVVTIFLFVGFLIMVFLLVEFAHGNPLETPSNIQVYFRTNGESVTLTSKAEIHDLINACENALTNSTSMAQLAVSDSTISKIKNASSIEIKYSKPKAFVITSSGHTLTIDRMLIPLSGEYAETPKGEKFVMVFYGNGRYESGPYGNSAAFHDRIVGNLLKLGISYHEN